MPMHTYGDEQEVKDKNPLIAQFDKDQSLNKEIEDRLKNAVTHFTRWDTVAKEDYKFALGDQWSEADKQELKDQGRPALTFNRIRPLINLVAGHQRENASRIKVNPEGGEDVVFSEVNDRVLKHVDKRAHLSYKMGYWFDDGCYCGKGWLEATINYDNDPIRGELDFKQRTPYQIKIAPDFREYDLNRGCPYLFKIVKLNKMELVELYPTKRKLIKGFVREEDDPITNVDPVILQEGGDDDYKNRPNITTIGHATEGEYEPELASDQKFTVKEYWRVKRVKRFFVIDKQDGEPQKFETEDEAKAFIAKQEFGKVVERMVPEMWVAAQVAGWILQNEKSPFEPYYSGYPFFRFMADWAPNAENEEFRVQGITRPLKDPQIEKNKAKSQHLHILNTQANSGWIGDDDALTEQGKRKLEEMGAKPGINVWKKKGSELKEILPKGPQQAHLVREEKANEEFTQISGINPDLMGFQEGTQSGRAISMRIKQAVMALVRLFQNYRYSKEIVGKFILQMIPMLFDSKKVMKVLGPHYMSKALDKEQYPEGLKEGHIAAFLQMISDAKYDVYVSEADQNSTIRHEIFQELTELLKAKAPIPIDLIIEYLDLPNSEEVKKRVQEYQAQVLEAQKGKGSPGAQ